MKRCTKCNIPKPCSAFYKDKQKSDGLRSQCIECRKKYNEDNKITLNEYARQDYRKNKKAYIKRGTAFHYNNKQDIKYRLRQIWHGMLRRCDNPKCKSYKYYGGRGVNVCARWHNFENFYEDMSSTYQIDLIIVQKIVNG